MSISDSQLIGSPALVCDEYKSRSLYLRYKSNWYKYLRYKYLSTMVQIKLAALIKEKPSLSRSLSAFAHESEPVGARAWEGC